MTFQQTLKRELLIRTMLNITIIGIDGILIMLVKYRSTDGTARLCGLLRT